MSATDGVNSPRSWDNEAVESVLPGLLGDTRNELSDDVFEQIPVTVTKPDSNSADESSIPTDDNPELAEDGHFVNPGEAELLLGAAMDAEDDGEEKAKMKVEDNGDDCRDTSDDGDNDDHDFGFDDLYSGDGNLDDDFGRVLS